MGRSISAPIGDPERSVCSPRIPSEFTVELRFPKAGSPSLVVWSLFSTHVCSTTWGSIGLGESMHRPEDRVHWFESSGISCTLSPTMSQPYSEKGKKPIVILGLDILKNETKPTHGPQGLTHCQITQGSTPCLLWKLLPVGFKPELC